MGDVLSLIGATMAWSAPLAAVRIYENAYALSYTGVNLACLSMTLLFLPILAFIYTAMPYPREIGLIGSFATMGALGTLIFSSYSLKSLDSTN